MKMKRFFAGLLTAVILLGTMPLTVFAYWEEPSAEGNIDLETTVYDYTKPVGVTMQRLTGSCVAEFGEDGNLGDDFLFVIKSGDRYYAMKDVPASETAYSSIPAVDVTDWVNADGSLTVPADTLGVAFWRYEERPVSELGMFINGRDDYIAYTQSYESADGDDDHYNDAERTYSAEFKIRTFEEGQWITDPYYWSENGVSGTLHYNGSWSYYYTQYNSMTMRYAMIVDLRDDSIGGKEFYFRYLGTNVEYVGNEVEGYLYYSDCRHQGTVRHAEYDAPTCMLKGCDEYWYCENCNRYAKDKSFTEFFGEEMPVIPATGHDFDNEKCANCNRPVPVYSKVTNQADFDALAADTMFVLVAEYNGKHYAMDFSEVYSYMTDSDGDGFYDIHDVDADSDDIPDYLEFDEGGGGEWRDEPNGIYDYLEWDMDDDGDVDDYDLHEFHLMVCDQHLTDMLYNNNSINATEIKTNPDGTISHEEAKKTAEFEMVDVYLAEDYDPDWHSHWENGEMPYHTKCVKQFVIPNYFLSAPSMRPVERMYRQRIYDFGDSSHWGVIFYDSREEYYSYVDGDMDEKIDADEDGKADPLPFPDISKEGSVAVFDTFDDIMWILYDEGQMAQLRLRDYNKMVGFVTGHSWELDWEWIDDESHEDGGYYDSNDTQACVYLYASAPYNSHTCDFGNWKDDENGRTHTRTCKNSECGKTETLPHNWDDGVQSGTATCTTGVTTTYTCTDNCGATKSETAEGLGHDWGDFADDGENSPTDTHSRTCRRNCGVAAEREDHTWGAWVKEDATNHKKTCSGCNGTRIATHTFGEWTPVGDGTTERRDCTESSCDAYETRTPHVCTFGAWYDTEDGMKHRRDCTSADCNEHEVGDHSFGDFAKIDENFHGHTCSVCNAQEKIEHSFADWIAKDDREHIHDCMECDHATILPHDYVTEVTKEPTEAEKGEVTYTCQLCSHVYTEELPKRIAQISGDVVGTVLNVPAGSNAYIPEGTVFDVIEQPATEVPEQVLGEIAVTAEGAAKPLGMYDLSLLLEGAKIQPDGMVEVTLPAPDLAAEYDKIIVVYIAPDGSYEECKTTVNEDGTITFETDHFSQYAVIGITEDAGLPIGAIIGIIAGALAVIAGGFCLYWFVFRKKRNA